MKYIYLKKNKTRLIVLLHGTGGNENSLLNLGEYIDENASLLGVRGNIDENGLNRFFKRLRPGIFDEENLYDETENLANFIEKFADDEGFNLDEVVMLGYSNGANILGSLLFRKNLNIKSAILMHPMVPTREVIIDEMKTTKILVTAGVNDSMVPVTETNDLFSLISKKYQNIKLEWLNQGHGISKQEIDLIKEWYQTIK
jgi:phospholipase/carboxylesterase